MLRAITPYTGATIKELNYQDVIVRYIIDSSDEPNGDEIPHCMIDEVRYRKVNVIDIIPDDVIEQWEEEILEEELNY